jgi:hypothetical protein
MGVLESVRAAQLRDEGRVEREDPVRAADAHRCGWEGRGIIGRGGGEACSEGWCDGWAMDGWLAVRGCRPVPWRWRWLTPLTSDGAAQSTRSIISELALVVWEKIQPSVYASDHVSQVGTWGFLLSVTPVLQ